jgi:hypothetical protein
MRDAGQVDDGIHSREQRTPVDRLRQIRMPDHFDAGAERRLRRRPHGGAKRVSVRRKSRYHRTADEAGCSGDKDATHAGAHGLPRTEGLIVFLAIAV